MIVKTVTKTSDTLLNWNTDYLKITNKKGYFVHFILNPHGEVVWLCYLVFLFYKRLRDLYEHLNFPLIFCRKCFKGFVPTTLYSFTLFFLSSSVLFLHFTNQFMSDFTCAIVTLPSVFSSSLCFRWYLKPHQLIVLALVLHIRQ